MAEKLAIYFGCIGEAGHYFHNPVDGRSSLRVPAPDFPWKVSLVDGGLLKNGKNKKVDGGVSWTCGGRPDFWFAFYWWDRSVDSRPGSNSGLYVRGFGPAKEAFDNIEAAFKYGCEQWPQVIERQKKPLYLIEPKRTDTNEYRQMIYDDEW